MYKIYRRGLESNPCTDIVFEDDRTYTLIDSAMEPCVNRYLNTLVHKANSAEALAEALENLLRRIELESPDAIFPGSAMRADLRRTLNAYRDGLK